MAPRIPCARVGFFRAIAAKSSSDARAFPLLSKNPSLPLPTESPEHYICSTSTMRASRKAEGHAGKTLHLPRRVSGRPLRRMCGNAQHPQESGRARRRRCCCKREPEALRLAEQKAAGLQLVSRCCLLTGNPFGSNFFSHGCFHNVQIQRSGSWYDIAFLFFFLRLLM